MNGDACQQVLQHKLLDDLSCETIFGPLIEDDDFKQFKRDKHWDATPMNQRCVMMTTPSFDNQCTYLQGILDARKADEARLLAARGEVINGIQYCICGNKLPKDVGKHLQTQLHERGCRKKGIWQVVQELPESDAVDVVQELPESDAVDVLVDVLDAAAFVTPPPQLLPAASPELSESTDFRVENEWPVRISFGSLKMLRWDNRLQVCNSVSRSKFAFTLRVKFIKVKAAKVTTKARARNDVLLPFTE